MNNSDEILNLIVEYKYDVTSIKKFNSITKQFSENDGDLKAFGLELNNVFKDDLSRFINFASEGTNNHVSAEYNQTTFVEEFQRIPNDIIEKMQQQSKSLKDLQMGINITMSGHGLDLIIKPTGTDDDLLNEKNFRVQKVLFCFNEESQLYDKWLKLINEL